MWARFEPIEVTDSGQLLCVVYDHMGEAIPYYMTHKMATAICASLNDALVYGSKHEHKDEKLPEDKTPAVSMRSMDLGECPPEWRDLER